MIRLHDVAATLAPLALVASLSAHAATYEILPTSTLNVVVNTSGPIPPGPNPVGLFRAQTTVRTTVGPNLGNTSLNFLAPQGAGAFTAPLSGTLGTTSSNNQLGFDQGTTRIALGNSGDWLVGSVGGTGQIPGALLLTPTPANFGITAATRFSLGPVLITHTLKAAPRKGEATLTGSTTLTGDPGDQTFDSAGLGLSFTSGLIYDYLQTCATSAFGGNCQNTFSIPKFTPSSVLPSGEGSLKIVGDEEFLTLPVAFTLTDTLRFQFQGPPLSSTSGPSLVEGTATWTANVSGQIVAVREVPEPSTVALLCGGVVVIGLVRRKVRG